ncbi:uncharacterized protein LOC119083918 [Bradysia coprophila]|uniref:uncharacterized protein LOC119083918 n=1 Tax=Bradysia coprophila TaxID=38358 RepID=UPI00187DAF88|nr:uncharacterized protein LOC119083918 [Bradysia coprophila]
MNDKIFCTEDGFAVKTLLLNSMPRAFQADLLFDYFSVFGSVQSARLHVRAADSFGFVKFDDARAAAKAFTMKHHVIAGHSVEVRIAKHCHQDEPATNDELRIELTNATGTEFMDLNDDCLRKICTHLTNSDLCSLAELSAICKINRLEAVTNETFSRKYSKSAIKVDAADVDETERLLVNFGSQMSYLSMDGSNEDSACSARRFRSIIQCCSGTLERLYLSNYKIGENETKTMRAVFSNLKELRISNCSFEGDAADLFASCTSLHTLHVNDNVPNKEEIFQHTFSNLTNFMCGHLSGSINYNLDIFISRHKSMERIQLLSKDDHSDLLPIIAQNCSELRALAVSTNAGRRGRHNSKTYRSLSSLKNLEKLVIANDPNAIRFMQELSHLQSLRELELVRICCDNEIVTAMSHLSRLETLRILGCVQFSDLCSLEHLKQLKELSITSDVVVHIPLVHLVTSLADLEILDLNVRNFFMIDTRLRSKIVNARSKSGSAKRTLKIVCFGRTTHIRF